LRGIDDHDLSGFWGERDAQTRLASKTFVGALNKKDGFDYWGGGVDFTDGGDQFPLEVLGEKKKLPLDA